VKEQNMNETISTNDSRIGLSRQLSAVHPCDSPNMSFRSRIATQCKAKQGKHLFGTSPCAAWQHGSWSIEVQQVLFSRLDFQTYFEREFSDALRIGGCGYDRELIVLLDQLRDIESTQRWFLESTPVEQNAGGRGSLLNNQLH
jgi:hypothetical protein